MRAGNEESTSKSCWFGRTAFCCRSPSFIYDQFVTFLGLAPTPTLQSSAATQDLVGPQNVRAGGSAPSPGSNDAPSAPSSLLGLSTLPIIAAAFSVFDNGESRCISVASKVLDVDSRLLALSKPACRARNRPHRELECRQSPDLTLAKKTHSN